VCEVSAVVVCAAQHSQVSWHAYVTSMLLTSRKSQVRMRPGKTSAFSRRAALNLMPWTSTRHRHLLQRETNQSSVFDDAQLPLRCFDGCIGRSAYIDRLL